MKSPGIAFRDAVTHHKPLQIVGAINAYCAMLAEHTGFRALYISGAGVANASYGLPDLGITQLADVLEDVRRMTYVTKLPILVDIDTGFGGAFTINRTIKEMIRAGAAAVHMEDQVQSKRCGHRPGKALVSTQEMVDRIKAAVDARTDNSFVLMARTDALSSEGLSAALERCQAYVEAGADMIFFEAATELSEYQSLIQTITAPILANITEFGNTPLFTTTQLAKVGVSMVLYPLSAFRAMSKAAVSVYETLFHEGTQQSVINTMQTREELYQHLNYHTYEEKLNRLFAKEEEK